jgi:hypothetical protein
LELGLRCNCEFEQANDIRCARTAEKLGVFAATCAAGASATLKKLEDNTKSISISLTINRVKSAAL